MAEGPESDAGLGIVRLTLHDMRSLGARVDDAVEISGNRLTVAKVKEFETDQSVGTIGLDSVLRRNAGTTAGSDVWVRRITPYKARSLVLAPFGAKKTVPGGEGASKWRSLLVGRVAIVGDWVRLPMYGSLTQDFHVADATPRGPVLIDESTKVSLKGQKEADPDTPTVRYEDIGGLGDQLVRIREMIELPLRHPELFMRLGIGAPKGVLLEGPPGCGKTLIARAVAGETSAYFAHINGPEVMSQYYGESEGRIRKIFEDARENAPAIIFIDEIDAIAPKREEVQGDVERRVVAQLLALMDGLESRGEVIVIGATNVAHILDPALRRPGRFDREITIGVPDRDGRLDILRIHSRYMPLADDVNLDHIADITHGYVGADLAALCREAAIRALRRMVPRLAAMPSPIPMNELGELVVTQTDFVAALEEVKPSALRDVAVDLPDVSWESAVGGLDWVRQRLREVIEWPLRYRHLFEEADIVSPRGILLSGPPGVGKTLIARAFAHDSGVNFISVKGPELLSKWVGESEKGVRHVFRRAKGAAPCILLFDEIDALAPSRHAGREDHGHVMDRVVGQLAAEIDDLDKRSGVVILAATNRLAMVDPALLRPGRFELVIDLPVPDRALRRAILQVHTCNKPLTDDVDLDELADCTSGLVGADIEALCRHAALVAMQELIEGKRPRKGTPRLVVSMRHFRQALGPALAPPSDSVA